MNRPKIIASVVVVYAALLTSCDRLRAPSAAPDDAGGVIGVGDVEFPIDVTDHLNRTITLSKMPRRIVSLTPSCTEILFAVGAGEQIVGVTEFCDYPPEANKRKKLGGFIGPTVSLETLVAIQPDVVFCTIDLHGSLVEELTQLNITVVAINPESLDEVYNTIRLIGRMTGHEFKGREVADTMQTRVQRACKSTAGIPSSERLTVFFEVADEPLMTAAGDSFMGAMLELAGGRNIFADLTGRYTYVNHESVIARNPDVILATTHESDSQLRDKIIARPGWDSLKAVRAGRIHLLDADLVARHGPRLADGLEQVARILYPARFGAQEPAKPESKPTR